MTRETAPPPVDLVSLADLARERGMDARVLLARLEIMDRELGGKLIIRRGGKGSHRWINRALLRAQNEGARRSVEDRLSDAEAALKDHERRILDLEARASTPRRYRPDGEPV